MIALLIGSLLILGIIAGLIMRTELGLKLLPPSSKDPDAQLR